MDLFLSNAQLFNTAFQFQTVECRTGDNISDFQCSRVVHYIFLYSMHTEKSDTVHVMHTANNDKHAVH